MSYNNEYLADYNKFKKHYMNNSLNRQKEVDRSDLRNKINDLRKNNRNRSVNDNSNSVNNFSPKENQINREEPPIKKHNFKRKAGENDFNQHEQMQQEQGNSTSKCIEILESNDIDLYKEYVQWNFINNIFYESCEKLLNVEGRGKQELKNTLQRWFIFINEDFNNVKKCKYYTILPDIGLSHHAAQFLRTAIIEKNFVNESDADNKMKIILNMISKSHDNVIPHNLSSPMRVEYNERKKVIVVGKFHSPEVPRVNLLVRKGGIIASARMLLRYESFGNGSYQWGDPKEVHKVLHDLFDVRYEGFASPVNSRFIEYENANFCSLFPDTDHVFGSLGNFFDVDMKKHCGGWSVNPPFLNDLMKKVAQTINNILDDSSNRCYFFCTFPCWEDDEGWQILDTSRHLLKRFNLKPQHFIVQDAYGRVFLPKMKMNLFVLGQLPDNKCKLIELGNILIKNNFDAMEESCPW